MRRAILVVSTMSIVLAGCGQQPHDAPATMTTRWNHLPVTEQVQVSPTPVEVQWKRLPAYEQHAILDVARHFGEAHPTVTRISRTETEADYKPMYLVRLRGHFADGKVRSRDLSFSILGDGNKAWAITDQSMSFPISELSHP